MTTIGVEIEIEGASEGCLDGLPWIDLKSHNDGSIRVPTYTIGDFINVIPRSNRQGKITCSGMAQHQEYGYEGVSRPIESEEMRDKLSSLSQHIGHVKGSSRSSIHFHVDVANKPWRYVQNVLMWAYNLEAVLFRLSCGGKHHRGETNDYRYCRPLSAPIYAMWGRTALPLINWEGLVNARSSTEFTFHWGRLDQYWIEDAPALPHYIGHRLHMLNLASVRRQGTMEWRLFDPIYSNLQLALDVILAVHRLAETRPVATMPMLLGANPAISCIEVSRLLDLDVSKLWGYRWSRGVENRSLAPHYGGLSFSTSRGDSIMYDCGEDDDPLYRR